MKEQVYQEVALVDIGRCPWQARKKFEGPKFDELCKSVREKGVLEPVLLRPVDRKRELAPTEGDFPNTRKKLGYQLVAGERRFRAAWNAAMENGGVGLEATIPAIVKELTDDEAFDIAMIENHHREDLTELEEAANFKTWLDRYGMERLEELSERIGIHPRYIRRRVRILGLPAQVLEAWSKGELNYGYLEQLNRLEDKKEVLYWFGKIKDHDWETQTVLEMKRRIDDRAPGLKLARFDMEKAGCLSCSRNSEVQAELFDCERMKGAHCLDARCFKKRQNDWFQANWKKTGFYKQHGTNGFRFEDSLPYGKFHEWYYSERPAKKCRECPEFVTRLKLDGNASHPVVCIGDESCFRKAQDKTKKNHESTKRGKNEKEEEQPRVAWHGEYFREQFFKEQIPLRLQTVMPDEDKALRLAFFALLNSEANLRSWFAVKFKVKDSLYGKEEELDPGELGDSFTEEERKEILDGKEWGHAWFGDELLFAVIEKLTALELLEAMKEASRIVLLNHASPTYRRLFAEHLGVDLLKEWRITKEYLDKKTTAEIHAIAAEFGLWERKEAKAFLFETLNKKRGNFKSCKKDELCRIILESGMDLAGVVPREIVGQDKKED